MRSANQWDGKPGDAAAVPGLQDCLHGRDRGLLLLLDESGARDGVNVPWALLVTGLLTSRAELVTCCLE